MEYLIALLVYPTALLLFSARLFHEDRSAQAYAMYFNAIVGIACAGVTFVFGVLASIILVAPIFYLNWSEYAANSMQFASVVDTVHNNLVTAYTMSFGRSTR